MSGRQSSNAYWRANIRIISVCLIIWALVSYGFGIILRPLISGIPVGGSDLGFCTILAAARDAGRAKRKTCGGGIVDFLSSSNQDVKKYSFRGVI